MDREQEDYEKARIAAFVQNKDLGPVVLSPMTLRGTLDGVRLRHKVEAALGEAPPDAS